MGQWHVTPPARFHRRKPWRRTLTRSATVAGIALILGAVLATLKSVMADPSARDLPSLTLGNALAGLRQELDSTRGRLAVIELELERANAVLDYSARYRIPADLAGAIYDAALSEGIHPSLGFQLVKVESGFQANARSVKNAIGYTQVLLPTARIYQPGITEEALGDRDTNLRIGFRFLNELLARFQGDMHLALLAYNRGPTRVTAILEGGGDPRNGYAVNVLSGLHLPAPKPLIPPREE